MIRSPLVAVRTLNPNPLVRFPAVKCGPRKGRRLEGKSLDGAIVHFEMFVGQKTFRLCSVFPKSEEK
jgi:hypothetical protein